MSPAPVPPTAQQAFPALKEALPTGLSPFYNGKFQTVIEGPHNDSTNPATGEKIATVGWAGVKDTIAALEAAQAAQPAWAATPAKARGRLLYRAAQIFREHGPELAVLDAASIGSPVSIMAGDAHFAADYMEFFAGLIPAVTGTTHEISDETVNYTVREPLGVVARITASNHPLMFLGFKLAAPLAMGNTIVLKPPEQAPLSSLRAMELIGSVFPPGVLNVVPGGIECGQVLCTHPIVRKITLVGSVPTGIAIQKAAAASLKLSAFELGGKNALIGYPDADLDKLVKGIVAGMNWSWCGQSCGSTSRVFLHESIHDEVLERVVKEMPKTYKPGNPLEKGTTMGSMVSKAAQKRVLEYIEAGKAEGARVVLGGTSPEDLPEAGSFVDATIFADVKQTMRIAQEEIFGPVMSVLKWTEEAQMITEVNSVDYGLTGAVYTTNITTAHRTSRKIQSGTVWVNTVGSHFMGMPFGGYKLSGLAREDCLEELYDFTQVKAVHWLL